MEADFLPILPLHKIGIAFDAHHVPWIHISPLGLHRSCPVDPDSDWSFLIGQHSCYWQMARWQIFRRKDDSESAKLLLTFDDALHLMRETFRLSPLGLVSTTPLRFTTPRSVSTSMRGKFERRSLVNFVCTASGN